MPTTVVHRELRFDLSQGDTDTRRRTPQGGLIVDANISRVGVFEYTNPDGSRRRELRTKEEVFHPDALKSFAHAPLTVEHPPGLVTPDTWKQVSVGHVGPTVEKDGKFVAAELHIQDAATIKKIESGELRELSCGYQCRLDTTPGTHPEFGDFDAKQIGIFGNHVAIGPKDWGRAGPEVRMHLDGGMSVSGVDASYVRRMPGKTKGAPKKDTRATEPETEPDETVEPEEEPEPERSDAREDAGELAALRAENKRLRTTQKTNTDAAAEADRQAREDARVERLVTLRAVAAPILSTDEKRWDGKGKTEDAIMREVLEVLEPGVLEEPEAKADAADKGAAAAAFIRGAFRAVMKRADRVTGGWKELGDVLRPDSREEDPDGGATPPRRDKRDEEETVEDAQAGMVAKAKDAWKTKDKRDRGKRDRSGR